MTEMTKREAYSKLRMMIGRLALPKDRQVMHECLRVLTNNGDPDTLDK